MCNEQWTIQIVREGAAIAHCALLIAHWALLIAHWALLIAHCSLLIAHCSLLIGHFQTFARFMAHPTRAPAKGSPEAARPGAFPGCQRNAPAFRGAQTPPLLPLCPLGPPGSRVRD